jgi:hypothetical protein
MLSYSPDVVLSFERMCRFAANPLNGNRSSVRCSGAEAGVFSERNLSRWNEVQRFTLSIGRREVSSPAFMPAIILGRYR